MCDLERDLNAWTCALQLTPQKSIARRTPIHTHIHRTPNSSRHVSYFRSIQGHSGGIAIDPELQDNVLLPKGFTEYIHHVGNVSEVHSIMRSGLIPGGQSLKRGRQSVFFTTVNPVEDENCVVETSCDLTKPWLKRKDCCFTRQGRMQSSSTTHYQLVCMEKVVCMKTHDELHQKIKLANWSTRSRRTGRKNIL